VQLSGIKYALSVAYTRPPRFIMNLADWDKYETLTNYFSTSLPIASNTNKEASNINKIILQSAYKSIPQTKAPKQQYNVPWWNKKLESLKNKKNTAWRTFNRN